MLTLALILDFIKSLKPGEAVPATITNGTISTQFNSDAVRDFISDEISARNNEAKQWRQKLREQEDAYKSLQADLTRLRELTDAGDGDSQTAVSKAIEVAAAKVKLEQELATIKQQLETIQGELVTTKQQAEAANGELTTVRQQYDATTGELTSTKTKLAEVTEAATLADVTTKLGYRPSTLKIIWSQLKQSGAEGLVVKPVEIEVDGEKQQQNRLFITRKEGEAVAEQLFDDIVKTNFADLADVLHANTTTTDVVTPASTGVNLPEGGIRPQGKASPIASAVSAAINSRTKSALPRAGK